MCAWAQHTIKALCYLLRLGIQVGLPRSIHSELHARVGIWSQVSPVQIQHPIHFIIMALNSQSQLQNNVTCVARCRSFSNAMQSKSSLGLNPPRQAAFTAVPQPYPPQHLIGAGPPMRHSVATASGSRIHWASRSCCWFASSLVPDHRCGSSLTLSSLAGRGEPFWGPPQVLKCLGLALHLILFFHHPKGKFIIPILWMGYWCQECLDLPGLRSESSFTGLPRPSPTLCSTALRLTLHSI